MFAERLATAAFSLQPAASAFDEGLLVLDLARGPSKSRLDYEASFLAALLADAPRADRPRIVLAQAASVPAEAAALSEAFAEQSSRGAAAPVLVLLAARGEKVGGVREPCLFRNGGRVLVLELDADPAGLAALLDQAAGLALAGHPITIGGPANPARFAARLILHVASFPDASRGAAGEVYYSIGEGDQLGLATALWAWRFGLPQTGLILPVLEGRSPEPGSAIVDRFAAEQPGALRGLVREARIALSEAESCRAELRAAGGPALDLASACSLAAARKALGPELKGHARAIVCRGADPAWDEASIPNGGRPSLAVGARFDLAPDARIPARVAALEAFLAELSPRLG